MSLLPINKVWSIYERNWQESDKHPAQIPYTVSKVEKITGDDIMMKVLIHQEDITILYVYVPNNKALKCTK